VQLAVLAGFVGVVVATRLSSGASAAPLAHLFFQLDPLVFFSTWLSAHAVVGGALGALAVLAVSAVLGRVFCGWFCPLGTVHAIAGRLLGRRPTKRDAHPAAITWQRAKYYLLAGLLAMAVCGSHWGLVLDPLVLLYRSTATAVLPALQWVSETASKSLYDCSWPPVQAVSKYAVEPVYRLLRDQAFGGVDRQGHAFQGGGLVLAIFAAIVLANLLRPRFWCRYLCPLGALLGLAAWRPLLRRSVDGSTCNDCGLCRVNCPGGAAGAGEVPVAAASWRSSECLGCMNCADSCRRGSLRFAWAWPWRKEPPVAPVGLGRRAVLGAVVAGVSAAALSRINPQSRGKTYQPLLVRPPGSRGEREFLARCTACGVCLKACPTGGLQPALWEAGLEGIWTPRLVPQLGPCEYGCNLCGQVCPTAAIVPLSVEEKQKTRIGLAFFDVTRCIPYAFGRECMVCEECCPIPDKAIYYLEVPVQGRDGQTRSVKQPHVDTKLCIGCGRCENMCPYKDRPGVRVFSANESRHPDNQPLLGAESDSPY
jgi:polyferredoxin/formate hydrogenlyase subunit 6/NADH:ubiquinone oxidoreductase subunit I